MCGSSTSSSNGPSKERTRRAIASATTCPARLPFARWCFAQRRWRSSARWTSRIQRWGRAIGEAGRRPIDLDELLRLQRIVVGDARFVTLGLRPDGGFVGEHDRDSRMPLPDHISARHEDLPALIDGMAAFDRGPALKLDPVIAAAVLAFGLVYIHPFVDGNGRIHRYLIHHVL